MIVGIPKEIIWDVGIVEKRVGLSPAGVKELTALGVEVFVETNAGEGAGFSDRDYINAGARIAYNKEEVFRRADMIVKIARPVKRETWDFFKENQILMGFLSLAVAPKEFFQMLIDKKITTIGYEVIETEDLELPILKPMSQIAGSMAVQIAGRLMENTSKWGTGILLGGIPGIPPAEIVIIGGGTLGMYAAKAFSGLGANVYIADRNPKRLEFISQFCLGRITTIHSNRTNLEKLVSFADVLILCAYIHGERAPILVTKDMVKTMKKGSVLIDFSIDQGGCSETSRLTPEENYIYQVDGVTHFCVPNVPAWVARTATKALTNNLLPYITSIVTLGIEKALKQNYALQKGTCTFKGKITHPHLATENSPCIDIKSIL
ncbi:MAG: alanine dehydrogenase [candidate division WOR-3 bacterium]